MYTLIIDGKNSGQFESYNDAMEFINSVDTTNKRIGLIDEDDGEYEEI